MKFSSLFSGAGGFDLGLEEVRKEPFSVAYTSSIVLYCFRSSFVLYMFPRLSWVQGICVYAMQAGHELIFLCESDPGARQVGNVLSDIHTIM